MLQTRAGHCPKCNTVLPSGVERCPECGFNLEWNKTNEQLRSDTYKPGPKPAPAPAAPPIKVQGPAKTFLRLFILFIVACVVTMTAVSYRSRVGNQTETPELESAHATSVQDAEEFRDQVKAVHDNPDFPEINYIIGMAMPNNTDVLEITVRNEWKSLDYPTRLNYAAKLVERWKSCHAPHRANITLLDEAGKEIGGRTWTGKVWVLEQHPDAPPPAKPATPEGTPHPDGTPGASGTPAAGEAQPNGTPAAGESTEASKDDNAATAGEKGETEKASPEGTAAPTEAAPAETPAPTAAPAPPAAGQT